MSTPKRPYQERRCPECKQPVGRGLRADAVWCGKTCRDRAAQRRLRAARRTGQPDLPGGRQLATVLNRGER